MKNKKIWRLVILVCGVMIILSYMSFFLNINTKYPAPKEIIHNMNDVLQVPKLEKFTFQIEEAELIEGKEVASLVPNFYAQSKESGLEYAVISLTIALKNASEIEQKVEQLKIAMLTMNKTYSNGLSLPATFEVDNEGIIDSVKPHQTQKIKLLYGIAKNNLKKRTYNSLRSQKFYYTYCLSPIVERVSLDLK